MLKTILLVLDGQSTDHGSVSLGIRWATNFDALLVGLGVIDEAEVRPCEPVPIGAGQAKRELDEARLHEQQVLIGSSLSAIALRCAHAQVAFKPLESVGRPAEEIIEEAQRFDLVIMPRFLEGPASQPDKGISAALTTVLRSTPRPIVAAPDTTAGGDAVVVAYDGSLQAARTLYMFTASGLAARLPVHVLSVHDNVLEAAKIGNRAIEFLAAHHVRATLHAKEGNDPVGQLLDLTTKVNAGLVVMGAYGKSRIYEFFVGSITRTTLAECPIPLFLYH